MAGLPAAIAHSRFVAPGGHRGSSLVAVSWGAPQDVRLGPMHLFHLEAVVFS